MIIYRETRPSLWRILYFLARSCICNSGALPTSRHCWSIPSWNTIWVTASVRFRTSYRKSSWRNLTSALTINTRRSNMAVMPWPFVRATPLDQKADKAYGAAMKVSRSSPSGRKSLQCQPRYLSQETGCARLRSKRPLILICPGSAALPEDH